jgi:hypothetical protein
MTGIIKTKKRPNFNGNVNSQTSEDRGRKTENRTRSLTAKNAKYAEITFFEQEETEGTEIL